MNSRRVYYGIYNLGSQRGKRKQLRQKATLAEALLWGQLRAKRLLGLKFRRQVSINAYVVDFYCYEKRLALEVDGGYHKQKVVQEYDAEREKYMQALGIKTLRFKNEEIRQDMKGVLKRIGDVLSSSPRSGEVRRGYE